MNVLVIGAGGREHALTWKIAQSPLVAKIFCAPGNPGMAHWAECIDLAVGDIDGLLAFAAEQSIALTVVGPEDPLAAGIVDRFAAAGLKAFGPQADAARLEASKVFAKEFMLRHGIPTAEYREFTDADEAIAYVKEMGAPIVVKADGLAAGKGVTVAQDIDSAVLAIEEAMREKVFGDAGARIVIEECLIGEEASIFALSDGKTILPLVSSQDHKPAYDGDTGPNTGGMGAYSPAPVVTDAIFEQIMGSVIRPCIEGMHAEGNPYSGVLYAGLMITDAGPKVIEFNCRFGDPETQVVLPRMKTDLVPLLMGCCDGTLDGMEVTWNEGACLSVVMASGGYPKAYEKGKAISGIPEAEANEDVIVFHAGTKQVDNELRTNGGRVLNVTALGTDIESAINLAYEAVEKIHFDGAHFRNDIGAKALGRVASSTNPD